TYAPGTYTVTLTVTNGPCDYQTTQTVILANEPADFTINRNPVCRNETFTLTAINSNQANIVDYHWTIGSSLVIAGTTRAITDSLPTTGTYNVTLRITDVNGCITTKTVPNFITVNGPTANFAPATPGAC